MKVERFVAVGDPDAVEDHLYQQIKQDIGECGLAVTASPGIAYTVGMLNFSHPELVLLGVGDCSEDGINASMILQAMSKQIIGDRLAVFHQTILVLDTARLLFLDVAEHRKQHLNFCRRYYGRGRSFDAVHVILPDTSNRLPGEWGYLGMTNDQLWAPWDAREATTN